MMLKQNLSPKPARRKAYLLFLPLLAILLSLTAFQVVTDVVPGVSLAKLQNPTTTLLNNEEGYLPTLRPVPGAIISGFGMRRHPVLNERKMHNGVDFIAPMNTPVKAAGSGTVKAYSFQPKGYGNLLTIDHGNGYQTRYAQLSEVTVKIGQSVQQGEVVALSGNSGLSTEPHLHFEIWHLDKFIDPESLLK